MKDEKWNFTAALIDAAGWGIGMGLISHTTFLPLYVSRLSDSPYAIGAISAALTFGWYVPGVFFARAIERLRRVKPWVLGFAVFERLTLLIIAALTMNLGRDRPAVLLASFFALWTGMNVAIGINTPAYYKLIAKTIPVLWRGRLYGYGGALAGLLGMGGGWLAGELMKDYGYPGGYAWCFLAAFVAQTAGVLPIAWMREPDQDPEPEADHPPERSLLSLARERRLRGIIVGHLFFCGSVMAAAYYADYAIRQFGAGEQTVARFTVISMAAQVAAYLGIGWIADRSGNRSALIIASLAGALASAAPIALPSLGGIAWAFALFQIATVGWGVCWINYVLEVVPAHRTASAVAVVTLFVGPVKVGLPLLGARMAQWAGYPLVFAAATVLTLLSLLLVILWLPEPRRDERHTISERGEPYPGARREDTLAKV